MWPFTKKQETPTLRFTNTLSGTKEEFTPLRKGSVLMYSCGPTVYGPQHIGNLRAAVFSDTLARTLSEAGYAVKRVVNITDVGHLVGDGDEGEDKMAVGAKRDGTTPEEIADRYTKQYLEDIAALSIDTNSIEFPRATAYIKEQVAMIRTLEKKGLAYQTSDGVYFDTEQFPAYGILGNVRDIELEAGKRVALGEKKNEHDFVLWRAAKENDLQQWDSPWGKGNPGWSIECSAMAVKLLGPTIDIHTGGQDHIQVHHNNEIAQSEGATGKKPFARYWLHNAFLTIGGEKISKSLGNTYSLGDVKEKGIEPLALRYLFLQAHYRTPLSFTWEALKAAEEGLRSLRKSAAAVQDAASDTPKESNLSRIIRMHCFNDLGTPQALASLSAGLRDQTLSPEERYAAVQTADALFGLSLANAAPEEAATAFEDLSPEIRELVERRERARENKDFEVADELRMEIEKRGYEVKDSASGSRYLAK